MNTCRNAELSIAPSSRREFLGFGTPFVPTSRPMAGELFSFVPATIAGPLSGSEMITSATPRSISDRPKHGSNPVSSRYAGPDDG